jgi:hypothetical protein
MNRPVYIAVPAWREQYVSIALRYTVPAIMASIKAWDATARVTFLVHTDNRTAFRAQVQPHRIEFMDIIRGPGTEQESEWRAFEFAHKQAIERAPKGALLVLLNADLVVSIETMRIAESVLQGRKKIGMAVGIRTVLDGNNPPVGADVATLSGYIWAHRHPIIEQLVWGRGLSPHPTMLFFPHENGGVISMHCFHLAPMFIVKDRELRFGGTIDDDLLENYEEHEIAFFENGEFAIAELSPLSKNFGTKEPLTIERIVRFAMQEPGIRKSHWRNFRHRFAILGSPKTNHPDADAIIKRLGQKVVAMP